MGHASGHGTIKPVPAPLLLKTFPIDIIEKNYRKKLKLKNDQINNIFTTTNTNTNTNTNMNTNSVNSNFENLTDIEEDSENTETDLEIMGIVDCQEIACG